MCAVLRSWCAFVGVLLSFLLVSTCKLPRLFSFSSQLVVDNCQAVPPDLSSADWVLTDWVLANWVPIPKAPAKRSKVVRQFAEPCLHNSSAHELHHDLQLLCNFDTWCATATWCYKGCVPVSPCSTSRALHLPAPFRASCILLYHSQALDHLSSPEQLQRGVLMYAVPILTASVTLPSYSLGSEQLKHERKMLSKECTGT